MSWQQTYSITGELIETETNRGISQDGRVERLSAYLLSKAHQNHNCLQNNHPWKRSKFTRKDLLQLKIWRRNQTRQVELWYRQVSYPGWAIHKWEKYYHYRGSPLGVRNLSPKVGSITCGSYARKMNRQSIWLWSPVMHIIESPRELGGNRDFTHMLWDPG